MMMMMMTMMMCINSKLWISNCRSSLRSPWGIFFSLWYKNLHKTHSLSSVEASLVFLALMLVRTSVALAAMSVSAFTSFGTQTAVLLFFLCYCVAGGCFWLCRLLSVFAAVIISACILAIVVCVGNLSAFRVLDILQTQQIKDWTPHISVNPLMRISAPYS